MSKKKISVLTHFRKERLKDHRIYAMHPHSEYDLQIKVNDKEIIPLTVDYYDRDKQTIVFSGEIDV